MPIYNVVMGQGVSIANLAGNTLSTGWAGVNALDHASQRLSTCSAIILGNTNSKAAGLYHLPAGSINTDSHSQTVLREMMRAVSPNDVFIRYGTADLQNPQMSHWAEAKHQQINQLESFLRAMLPSQGARLSSSPAKAGTAWVVWDACGWEFSVSNELDLDDVTKSSFIDLRKATAGQYPNYRVHGRML